jgi:hypothetical protein
MATKWKELANKHLVGRTIVKVEWLSPKESQDFLGWDYQPCEIFLDNGIILTPSADDEANNAGAILTNIEGLGCLPVFREETK